jgi:hypothetical protein
VRDTVLTGLSTATNAVISAADSVLSALGKLQAQITSIGARNAANGYVGTGADGRMAVAQLPQTLVGSVTVNTSTQTNTASNTAGGTIVTQTGHSYGVAGTIRTVEFTGTTPTELPTNAYFYLRVEDANSYKVYPTWADANAQTNVLTFANALSNYNSRFAGLSSVSFSSLTLTAGERYRLIGDISIANTGIGGWSWFLQTNVSGAGNNYHTPQSTQLNLFGFVFEALSAAPKYARGNFDLLITITTNGFIITGTVGSVRTNTADFSGVYTSRSSVAVSGVATLASSPTLIRVGDSGASHPLNYRNGSNVSLYRIL